MMLKRLYDQPSCYDKKVWFKDFEKSQNYKKNICVFPSIKFFKEPENEKIINSSASKFYDKNNPGGTPKIRSKTSHQKFKLGSNTFEKLYGSKYFQNNEDSSNHFCFSFSYKF